MPANKEPLLSVSEVFELEPGTQEAATWINPGFIALVDKIVTTKAKSSGKPMHICTLVNEDRSNACEISMTIFRPTIAFKEGDTIEVFGKGLRRTEYNGLAQATVGNDTEIHVTARGANRGATSPKPAPARTGPRNDTRGSSHEPEHHDAPTGDTAEPHNPHFHQKMSATALFYLHCLSYARKINTTLKATGHPEMSPDHFQACVSTLFIAGDRNGLAVAPPPSHKISPTPAAEPAPKAEPRKPAAHVEDDSEVPF